MVLPQGQSVAGEVPIKEFMVDHLKATSGYRGSTGVQNLEKRLGLFPTPPPSQLLLHNRKGEPTSLTPSEDRVFFPPYKFPYWGFPYGIYSKGGFFNPGLFPFVPGG